MPTPSEGSFAPASGGNQAARMFQITTLVNGVPTVVSMPVVAIANAGGTVVDLNLANDLSIVIQLLADIRKELMIFNNFFLDSLNLKIEPDAERANADLDNPYGDSELTNSTTNLVP